MSGGMTTVRVSLVARRNLHSCSGKGPFPGLQPLHLDTGRPRRDRPQLRPSASPNSCNEIFSPLTFSASAVTSASEAGVRPAKCASSFASSCVPGREAEFLEIVGRQHGCLAHGGRVDLHKIARIVLNEFRSGQLGAITLETPARAEAEQIVVQRAIDEKAALEAASKKQRKAAFQARGKPGR